MKKFIFLIPLVLLLSCNSGADISPADTYVKFYGGGASYELLDMTLRADGQEGVVLLALRTGDLFDDAGELLEANRSDLYVVVTNGVGNAEFEQRIPIISNLLGSLNEDALVQRPARITAKSDGGYYVVTTTSSAPIADPSNDALLAVWAEYDNSFELTGATPSNWNAVGDTIANFYGIDIAAASDGGVVVAGYYDSNGSNDLFYDKIGGAQEWSRRRDRTGDDRAVRLFALSNGKYALFSRTDVASTDGEGGANVERRIILPTGIIDNSLTYGITWQDDSGNDLPNVLHDVPYDVIEKPGGFAVVGASFQNSQLSGESIPFFMNVDLTGANADEVDYRLELQTGNSNQSFGRAIGLTQTTTNDFIIVGEVDGLEDNGKEIMILKADQAGELIAEPIRYGLLNGDESARRALTAADGSIYVGTTYDFGGGLSQIGLLKLNADGELKQ